MFELYHEQDIPQCVHLLFTFMNIFLYDKIWSPAYPPTPYHHMTRHMITRDHDTRHMTHIRFSNPQNLSLLALTGSSPTPTVETWRLSAPLVSSSQASSRPSLSSVDGASSDDQDVAEMQLVAPHNNSTNSRPRAGVYIQCQWFALVADAIILECL